MVYIEVIDNGLSIILNCHKKTKDGDFFQLVIDAITYEVIEKPQDYDIDVSIAYAHIYGLLKEGKPLPNNTVACWG